MTERKPARKKPAVSPLRSIGGRLSTNFANGSGEVDKLIHERSRLAIVSALAVHESLSFNELKEMLGASDGNLSVHARKLEEAGYIACTKSFAGRLPRTEYVLSAAGRRSLERYLAHMESLIRAVRDR